LAEPSPRSEAAFTAVSSGLEDSVRAITGQTPFAAAHWGILVERADGEPVLSLAADDLLAPASTVKLFTAAAALDMFGPDFRFETPLYARGELDEDGTLHGDLILVASGDFVMGGRALEGDRIDFADWDHTYANGNPRSRLTRGDPTAGLAELATQVAARGVRKVAGDVLIDDRLFDSEPTTGSGPRTVSPIAINDNLIDLTIAPTVAGARAQVTVRPFTKGIGVDNQVMTTAAGPARVQVHPVGLQDVVVVGQVPADQPPVIRVHEVADPATFARTLLIEALGERGVTVAASLGQPNNARRLPNHDEYPHLPRVARLLSPPFAEAAQLVLKTSHNLHASALPLLMAARRGQRTLNFGLSLEAEFLRRAGVDPLSISLASGAGGARGDFITPRAAVTLLQHMRSHGAAAAFRRALPVLGVDGTLAHVVDPRHPLRGRLQAKTGTYYWHDGLNDRCFLISKALSGYMQTARGDDLIFFIGVNNVPLASVEEVDRVGDLLVRICEAVWRHA
jgi:D-alanyl-D-alanine carboxypeptidase/D-alanyl-D-alanine-endopeptidase (penicillin-binding protein 4)